MNNPQEKRNSDDIHEIFKENTNKFYLFTQTILNPASVS